MLPVITKHHRLLFYSCWLLFNLLQARYTELFDDEAYYWVYTRFPAWGYFDHPPMIAWLIGLGYSIFENELGVRLLVVLMNTGTLLLVEALTAKKNPFLFYAICASIAIVQIAGIIAVPDLPLLFFAALFFTIYRKFIRKMTPLYTILMGLVIALLLYSKYHGVLIVLFTLLSNAALFKKLPLYLAGFLALLLFAPHLYWQYIHDFPSMQFHLFERNAPAYKAAFTLDYIGGQLLLAGPVIGWLLIWAAMRHKPMDKLESALKFTMAGFYLFFLASTFKGRVEANWTVPAMIGVIVLSHQFLQGRRYANWVFITIPFTLLLVMAVRVYMVLDIPQKDWLKKDEIHHNRARVKYMQQQAGEKPVVFINSYQKPSKMWFYGASPSFSMNTPRYRRNNYNYWPLEDSLMGKTVLVTGKYDTVVLNHLVQHREFDSAGMAVIEKFYSFSKVQLKNIVVRDSRAVTNISFTVQSPSYYLPIFHQPPADTAHLQLAIYKKDSVLYYPSQFTMNQVTSTHFEGQASFPINLPEGKYKARLAISSVVHGHPTLNSLGFEVEVKR